MDLDNTVYDWISYFAPAIRGMCRVLAEMTSLPSATLYAEFRAVFAIHGTVEYSFALQELPSLRRMHPGVSASSLVELYRPAVEMFQHRRRAFLRPYPGVRSGIDLLHQTGYEVIGVTEGRRFQAENRLRQLKLDSYLDGLFCMADHAVPDPDTVAAIRRRDDTYYKSNLGTVIAFPVGLSKPSPGVLDFVISALGVDYGSCVYVGDSLSRDVAMAQRAGVYDCWAEYGSRVSVLDFATLARVTDWPRRAVKAALNPSPERLGIFPSFTATSFDAVVDLALLEPAKRPRRHVPIVPPRQLSLLEIGPSVTTSKAARYRSA